MTIVNVNTISTARVSQIPTLLQILSETSDYLLQEAIEPCIALHRHAACQWLQMSQNLNIDVAQKILDIGQINQHVFKTRTVDCA